MTIAAEPSVDTPAAPSLARRLLRTALVVVGVLVALAIGGWLTLQWLQPYPYSGTILQAPSEAPSMDGLLFSDGSAVDLERFRGDLVIVYFGYTACPDVCPTTLAQVAAARRKMGDDADRVHMLMVSVDPERDDLASLGSYVTAFDPTFLGATGEPDAVERVAAQYGIFYAKGEPLGDGYAIDHTASLIGIDTNSHLRILWPVGVDAQHLANDFHELL